MSDYKKNLFDAAFVMDFFTTLSISVSVVINKKCNANSLFQDVVKSRNKIDILIRHLKTDTVRKR